MRNLYLAAAFAALAPAAFSQGFTGRWDLTIKTAEATYPSWIEAAADGTVRVVGRVASVHPAKDVKLEGSHLTFTTQEWFGKTIPVKWDLHASGKTLTGTQERGDGVKGAITGVPAPALKRPMPAKWSQPQPLFNGRDLTGWEPIVTESGKPPENHYKAIHGELVNEAAGANIRTTRTFQDFKLHVEFNCPDGGNSGVYLRGRYEVQVEYEPPGTDDKLHSLGAIYGFLAPSIDLPRTPGQWETFDITLVGRRVTVARNGKVTIADQEIPGITGGALNSHEGEPGPIYIQGDHTGGMKYRNITIQTPER